MVNGHFNIIITDDIQIQFQLWSKLLDLTSNSELQRRDGEQKITPFNLNDENEEGHFDENGTFIFDNKDKNEIRDSWLDSIDMQKVY